MTRGRATTLAVAVTLAAVSALAASAAGGPTVASSERDLAGAPSTQLSPAEKKARAKALRKCRRIASRERRQACLRRVERRFGSTVAPSGPPVEVQVRDKYFSPDLVEIERNKAVRWVWSDENADPHNVTLREGPKGVSLLDFRTPTSPAVRFTFTRTFKVPGNYRFACSLHHLMTMTVEVGG